MIDSQRTSAQLLREAFVTSLEVQVASIINPDERAETLQDLGDRLARHLREAPLQGNAEESAARRAFMLEQLEKALQELRG
ncbi:hypothetical protein [Roseomonas populi]|uniref:Uncharacterized protein n=1 Tax=Roseomonas populi TaxID=3121582 RepID=A0ABT1WY33_9PROT|nr:hypothetical protein [Roseomonas pecuniae]MCR0980745.1 hypothetical protein [Roseomonas pecuniae]